jgi:hypothetical protein
MTERTPLYYFKEIKEVSKEALMFAAAPSNNMFERGNYRTGDGDYVQPLRPGSEDHKQWKSRGLLSSNLG